MDCDLSLTRKEPRQCLGRGEKVDKDREKLSPFGKQHHGKHKDGDDGLP